MRYGNRWAGAAIAALFAAAPLAAQIEDASDRQMKHSVVVGVYAGGYDHILDLTANHTADFTRGTSYGATVGFQVNRYLAVHGDFTFTRNRAEGNASFAGMQFNRFFYGAHAELGYPLTGGITPYLFLGGGAVTVDEVGSAATLAPFTRPAGMFGAGIFASLFGRFEAFAEAKDMVYNWNRGGFDPVQWYIPTTGGQIYWVGWDTGHFNRMQWDFTYTAGVAYRFKRAAKHPAPQAQPSYE
jgi:opacity protein-like surface antigen